MTESNNDISVPVNQVRADDNRLIWVISEIFLKLHKRQYYNKRIVVKTLKYNADIEVYVLSIFFGLLQAKRSRRAAILCIR